MQHLLTDTCTQINDTIKTNDNTFSYLLDTSKEGRLLELHQTISDENSSPKLVYFM